MADTPVVSFRLPPELVERLDALAARLATEAGRPCSRNAALVKVLTEALAGEKPPKGKRT